MKKSIIIIGEGGICPKCGELMQRRTHKEITPKMIKNKCFFSEWDYCKKCNAVFFKEEYRIWKTKSQKIIENEKKTEELKEFLKTF